MTTTVSGGGILFPGGGFTSAAGADFMQDLEPDPLLVVAFCTWGDTTNMLLKRRNAANTAWVTLGPLLDYMYGRSNIVGTVSQSGGLVTGAGFQSGTNANGGFAKSADGRLLQWGNAVLPGTTYQYCQDDYSFPTPFADKPRAVTAIVTSNNHATGGWQDISGGLNVRSISFTYFRIQAWAKTGSVFTTSGAIDFTWQAVGFWY